MKSIIYLRERIHLKRAGNTKNYFPCTIEIGGVRRNALFTNADLVAAIDRASKVPDEMPTRTTWKEKIIAYFKSL